MKSVLAWLAKVKASPETAQQWAHFSIPLLSFLTLHRFGVTGWWLVGMAIFWLTFSLLIEDLFDPIEEHDPFWPKGFRDVCFYWAGTSLGFLLTL
jgi:hypothetical protein